MDGQNSKKDILLGLPDLANKTFFIVYLKFKYNWVSCILYSNPILFELIEGVPIFTKVLQHQLPLVSNRPWLLSQQNFDGWSLKN